MVSRLPPVMSRGPLGLYLTRIRSFDSLRQLFQLSKRVLLGVDLCILFLCSG
jgi:hypothetical protein